MIVNDFIVSQAAEHDVTGEDAPGKSGGGAAEIVRVGGRDCTSLSCKHAVDIGEHPRPRVYWPAPSPVGVRHPLIPEQ